MANRISSSISPQPDAIGGHSNVKAPSGRTLVEIVDGSVRVDATIIAEGLATEPSLLLQRMRERLITSRCERGIAQDQGRYRLTFFSQDRGFRVIVDAQGSVLQRSTLDVGARVRARRHASRR